jgi:hypothetical protein
MRPFLGNVAFENCLDFIGGPAPRTLSDKLLRLGMGHPGNYLSHTQNRVYVHAEFGRSHSDEERNIKR